MFDRQCVSGPALPAGRRPLSIDELRRMWASTSAGRTDWFDGFDPALVTDGQIVEMISELLCDPPIGTVHHTNDQSATSSTSYPSSFSRYVA